MNEVTKAAQRHDKELAAADEANFQLIEDAYSLMYDRIQGDIDALTLAIEKLESPTIEDIERLPQYKRLMRVAEEELDKFTTTMEVMLGAAGISALSLGLSHSEELVNIMTGGGFAGLEANVLRPLLDFLQEGGALYTRLQELTGSVVDGVIQTIIDGVMKGQNPRVIAAAIQDAFGRGLTDALRMMRTLQLYAYRQAALANYLETGGIVTGWVWFAHLDSDVCLSCVSMHGTIHSLEETLNDHHNGRCAPLPYIPEFGNPVEQSGEDWFKSLSPAQQAQMMGNGKFQAWRDGLFQFNQLSKVHTDDVYGDMRTETPLKDLVTQ